MPVRLGRFELPREVQLDDRISEPNCARFIIEPFEAGYGRTLGNSLRRVLLSSLEGSAVTRIKIDGAAHEYCALPGVTEDVTDIVLNIKKLLCKMYTRDVAKISIDKKGPGAVTGADVITDESVEILNPDHHIATLDKGGHLKMEMDVEIGRGYCPADWNKPDEQIIGVIPVDALFSPVKRVKYEIENTRVGQRTDYDKLIIEIITDGRITPREALTNSAAILRHHLDVFVKYDKDLVQFENKEKEVDREREELRKKLNISVNEIELSVRAANCLNNANIVTLGELAQKTENEMLRYRNFGKKSLNEIKDKLSEWGFSLGMTFDEDVLGNDPLSD